MAKLEYKLTRDTLFKLLFTKYPDLLKNLVSRVLGIAVDAITKFVITNPRITPKDLGGKFCVLDINMEVNKQIVNIEVQVNDEKDYPERSLFYWARSYSNELKEGGKYVDLKQTIGISIVDFKLFEDTEDFHSEFRALEVTRHTELTDKMRLHYFELEKLPAISESDTEDGLKIWLSLFNANTDEEMSKIEKIGGEVMEQAVQAYKSVVVSKRFKEIERMREKTRLNEASALDFARRQGITQGITQGKAEGIAENQKKIVLNMHKKGFNVTEIAEATELPENEVNDILKTINEKL